MVDMEDVILKKVNMFFSSQHHFYSVREMAFLYTSP